jgi:hypothetical protein
MLVNVEVTERNSIAIDGPVLGIRERLLLAEATEVDLTEMKWATRSSIRMSA